MKHANRSSKKQVLAVLLSIAVWIALVPSAPAAAYKAGASEYSEGRRAFEQTTNLLSNGTFETGNLNNWTTEGAISAVKGIGYNNSYGAQMNGSGRLYQVFNTTSAKKYTVNGWIRINRQISAPKWGGVRIQISDSSWKELTSSPYYTIADSKWIAVSLSFTASSKQSRITFENFSGNGQFDAVFDDAVINLSSSATATPTASRTPTATVLPATPTRTATTLPTATPLPPTATMTATNTPIPPTATSTPLAPTATRTATNTVMPPTATSTATSLPATPTNTATQFPTATPVLATATATATALVATATPGVGSSLLQNSGFETGSLSGWEDYGGISVAASAAFSGSYGARMTDSGRIDQSFSTTIGQSYTVRAKLRLEQQSVAASWGGLRFSISNTSWQTIASSQSYTSNNAALNQWIEVVFSFTANSSSSRLSFQNFSNGKFVASVDDLVVIDPAAVQPAPSNTPTATPTNSATVILTPTSTSIATPTNTAMPVATATPIPSSTPIPSPTSTSAGTILEGFEGTQSSWLVTSNVSGNATIQSANATVFEGQTSAMLSTNSSAARAQLQSTYSDSASSHSWEERPGTWSWQRTMIYVPSSTVSQLQSNEYFTLAGLYPSAGGSYGWYLRIRQSGQLSVYGYTADAKAAEFPANVSLPLDRWVSLELGLHSQAGPGVKRSFAFLIDGDFYGWYRQGNMGSETYNRAAFGILDTSSSANLQVYIDAWQQPGTGSYPTGPDNRSAAALQTQDFRTLSGAQVQYDWSTWAFQPTLHSQYGIYSAMDRIQAGRNLDRMPDLRNGWAEIEIDWPKGTPAVRSPQGYFGPMLGFRKEINREQNLEIIPIGNGNGTVDLALEAWIGSPVILARWPMPVASIGGTSIPEPGDIIRVRWEETGSTSIAIRASYYDASAAQWYTDIISGNYTLNAVSNGSVSVNYLDGYHTASSITIDTAAYSIRRYTVGSLESYP